MRNTKEFDDPTALAGWPIYYKYFPFCPSKLSFFSIAYLKATPCDSTDSGAAKKERGLGRCPWGDSNLR